MAGANGNSRWTDALLDRMRNVGDPVADAPVAAVLERGGVDAVSAIMRTLVRADQPVPEELPEEIRAYLAETLPLPEWADMRKIRRGQQLFETWCSHHALPVLRVASGSVRGGERREGAVPDRPARYRRASARDGDRPVPDGRTRRRWPR